MLFYSRWLLLGLLTLALVGCGPTPPPTHRDIGVAKFKIPEGWLVSDGEGDNVVLLTRETEEDNFTAIISIDLLVPPEGSTFLDAANAYAGKFQGTINPKGLMIDGEKAIHVEIPKQTSLGPTDCFVVLRGKNACFINGGSIGADSIRPVLDQILESWEWNEDSK